MPTITALKFALIQEQVESCQNANYSNSVSDPFLRDQERAKRLEAMQAAITKGFESGEAKSFDLDSFKQRMLNSL